MVVNCWVGGNLTGSATRSRCCQGRAEDPGSVLLLPRGTKNFVTSHECYLELKGVYTSISTLNCFDDSESRVLPVGEYSVGFLELACDTD